MIVKGDPSRADGNWELYRQAEKRKTEASTKVIPKKIYQILDKFELYKKYIDLDKG